MDKIKRENTRDTEKFLDIVLANKRMCKSSLDCISEMQLLQQKVQELEK